jgi:hypothetical protein
MLEDISVAGAKLNVGAAPVLGTRVFLLLDDYGRIAWQRNSRLGLNFSVVIRRCSLAQSPPRANEAKPG